MRNEWFTAGRNAPDGSQELAHRRDHCDLASGPKPFILLAQPRIAPHGVENHHPERLSQAGVSERDCWTAGETLLARLPQPRRYADIARDRTGTAKARRISEFCDQTSRGQGPDPIDRRQQFAHS